MAPRLPRRPRADDDPEDPDGPVRLDDEAHAWWAQRPAEDLLRSTAPPAASTRDILAEHFGSDWRTSWELDATSTPAPASSEPALDLSARPVDLSTPPSDAAPATPEPAAPAGTRPHPDRSDADGGRPAAPGPERGTVDPRDAYAVLGVTPTATWEDIVAAHRAMARLHHPDRVASAGAEATAAAEEQIRRVNAAYAELRIRRGR